MQATVTAGVSYLIDNIEGSCSWSSLKQGAMVFSKIVNNYQVRMETPREFFMDSTISYQYEGSVSVPWGLLLHHDHYEGTVSAPWGQVLHRAVFGWESSSWTAPSATSTSDGGCSMGSIVTPRSLWLGEFSMDSTIS